jgi:hypothetical protein
MKMSYFHTLLAEVCTGVAPEVNAKALAWGKQYEADARTLFEFTTDVQVTESPILFRDEGMRTACSPDGLCSDGRGLELKCPFTSRDFMKFRLGGFEAIKSAYMAQVQFSMWVTGKDAWYFANYDPRMKREGIHHVVVERDDKYMSDFNEMVPEFISKMDESLAEIGLPSGSSGNETHSILPQARQSREILRPSRARDLDDSDARSPCYRQRNSGEVRRDACRI